MSYVPAWIRTARDAERDLGRVQDDPMGPYSAACWKQFREVLEKSDRNGQPVLGIWAQIMGMITYFNRNADVKGKVKQIWGRTEREMLRSRPPNADVVKPWKPGA